MAHEELPSTARSDDPTSPAVSDPPQVAPGSSRSQRPVAHWRQIRHILQASTLCPAWLPTPWNTPLAGYLVALCLPVITALLMLLLLHFFPTFALQGALTLLATLLIALAWGQGPGLLATLVGTILFDFVLMPTKFTWSLSSVQPLFETGLFLVIGVAISLLVPRIEYARGEAERAREQVKLLMKQLELEEAQTAAHVSKTEQHRQEQRTREALHALLQFAEALVHGEITQEPPRKDTASEAHEEATGVDEVSQRLAALIKQVSGYQNVSITALNAETGEPQATATVGLSPEQEQAWRERRPGFTIGELVVGTSVEAHLLVGEAVVIDLEKPPFSERGSAYGPLKLLLVPMLLERRLIGIVTLNHGDTSHDYTLEEQALARALAQLAALTLERTRLFQERTQTRATVLALRETNRLMDEFIGIAGHELRTPLTTIKANVELTRRQISKALKQQESLPAEIATHLTRMATYLDRTERQIRMQNRLVSDLLDVTRVHANRLELHPDLCDLMTLVREGVEDQSYLTPTRNITLTSTAPEEILVMADADRIRQVISNYLSNALKYSEADKPVEVRVELVGKLVRVSVRDEGPGLSRAQQQHLWERFYRVPEIVVKSGSGIGLGLGLHITRMIIERLGGQVGVQSTPGEGSTFWFTLPLIEAGEKEGYSSPRLHEAQSEG